MRNDGTIGDDLAIWRTTTARPGLVSRSPARFARLGSEVDAKGNFLLTKHVDVTLTIFKLTQCRVVE